MSEPKFTADQLNAIEARGGTILVSAAAGSGKTAVLVERIMRLLCDRSPVVDADRLLVVTFTNAAAAEMRQKIHYECHILGEPLARQESLAKKWSIRKIQ